jgi:hypothetical protein
VLEIDPKTEFAISENVILKALPEAGHYYAFNVENGDHFSLNSTAYWVLEKINQNGSVESLIKEFSKEFELKKEEAFGDLSELFRSALKNQIIIRRCNNEEKKDV